MFNRVRRLLARPTPAPSNQTDDEELVDRELMFHLRCLVDDNLRRGMSFDAAWDSAETRFGPLRRHADSCRRVEGRRRWAWLGVTAAALIVPVLLFAVYLRRAEARLEVALARDRAQQAAALAAARVVKNPATPRAHFDLSGSLVSLRGEGIARGTVLAILKTWPGGRYRQQAFSAETDADGHFSFPKLVPSEGQYAVHLAALKEGFALTSTYQLVEASDQPHAVPEAVTLELDDAVPLTLFVEDADGHRIADARVIPSARQASEDTPRHFVYFQAAEPIQTVADRQGRVALKFFQRGDQAQIYLQIPGRAWEEKKFRVPNEGDAVVVIGRESAADSSKPAGHRSGKDS